MRPALFNSSHRKRPPRPWRILALVVLLGLVSFAAIVVSARLGVRIIEKDVPLQDASMSIKYELSLFHLSLENSLSSVRHQGKTPAWEHIDKSKEYALAMMEGGKGPDRVYFPMKDPAHRRMVAGLINDLDGLRAIAGRLVKQRTQGAVPDEEWTKFDVRFEALLKDVDALEVARHGKITDRLKDYEAITAGLLISCVLFTVAVGAVLYRDERRKAEYVAALSESEERLKRHEKQLAESLARVGESESKFRTLVEESLVGVYIYQDGGFIYVNPRMVEIFGCGAEELTGGKGVLEFVHPDDRGLVEEKVRQRMSGEVKSARYQSRWVRYDGAVIDIEVIGSRTEYNGRPAIIGTMLDITEHKRAEDALRRSERQQKAILDNIPDLAWLKDREGRYIAVNGPFSKACGMSPEDVTGKTDLDIWPAELAERYGADDIDVMKTGLRKAVEERLTGADGVTIWIHTIKTPIYNDAGDVIGTIGIARDITERKDLEQQKADFHAMVTHDLKSPLMAVIGYSDLILSDMDKIGPDTAEMVEGIGRAAKKLTALVEDYLALSRMESGKLTLSLSKQPFEGIISEAVGDFSAVVMKKGLSLDVEAEKDLPLVIIDRRLLQRAMSNLLQNAVNYTPSGGIVKLRAGYAEDGGRGFVFVSVSDNGAGISPSEQGRVFDKYYRSSRVAGVGGSGLGLAIVKAVAEAHGGRVELDSAEGKGSTFSLFIPASKENTAV